MSDGVARAAGLDAESPEQPLQLLRVPAGAYPLFGPRLAERW
jgi:hypothetical protein